MNKTLDILNQLESETRLIVIPNHNWSYPYTIIKSNKVSEVGYTITALDFLDQRNPGEIAIITDNKRYIIENK